MQRTAKARFYVDGVLPVVVSQIGAYCAGKVVVIGGVFSVAPPLMASVIRAAADWQRWASTYQYDIPYECIGRRLEPLLRQNGGGNG
jgi:hypothetical protein